MRISDSLKTSLNIFADSYINSNALFYSHYSFNYFNNSLFDKFLHIDLSSSNIEIPLLGKSYTESILEDVLLGNCNAKELNITLINTPTYGLHKTSNSIFKTIGRNLRSKRLISLQTFKGEVYYGGNGLLLDKNKNPLLFITIGAHIGRDNIIEDSLKIYLDPSVITSDNMLEKAIRKQVIPYYLENGIYIATYCSRVISNFKEIERFGNVIPEIIIKNFADMFFVSPIEPSAGEFNNHDINEFLSDNTNLVCNSI